MSRSFGDEIGFMWETPIKVGSSAARGGVPREKGTLAPRLFKQAPKPQGYKLPTHFPSLKNAPYVILDVETLDPKLRSHGPGTFRKDAYIVGYGVRTDAWEGDYYPVRHKDAPNLEPAKVAEWLADELNEYRGEVIGANIQYDAEHVAVEGIHWKYAKWGDPQIMGPLLDENAHSYSLGNLSSRVLGETKVTDEIIELYGPGFIENFHLVHPGHARAYVMGDLDLPWRLVKAMRPMLEAEGLWDLYDMERRLIPFLLYMRQQGVRFDVNAAQQLGERLKLELKDAKKDLKIVSGLDIDIWSPVSIAKGMEKCGLNFPLTPIKENLKGKVIGGAPSFKKAWLEAQDHPFTTNLLKARSADKYSGTFVEGWLEDCIGDRLHCQFHQLRTDENGTVSGRLSSSNPNLQQVPIRSKTFGSLIRGLFIPEPGHQWFSFDYSQIEYRFLVHYAVLVKAVGADVAQRMYRDNPDTDFHTLAAQLTGKPRATAKNINFGIVYGMGMKHMAEVMGFPATPEGWAAAKAILDEYHAEMPFSKETYNLASKKAGEAGFIRTILGRRRRFELWEPTRWQQGGERAEGLPKAEALEKYGAKIRRAYTHKALNSLLQGSAADMNKKALVDVWEAGLFGPGNPLIAHLTVHDELDGSSNPDDSRTREALDYCQRLMENALRLEVPVLVGRGIGENWGDAH